MLGSHEILSSIDTRDSTAAWMEVSKRLKEPLPAAEWNAVGLTWGGDCQRRWTVREGTRMKGNWARLIIEIPLHIGIKVYLPCYRYRKGASHLSVYGQPRREGKVGVLPQPATMHVSLVQHSLSCQGAILRRRRVWTLPFTSFFIDFFSFNYSRHHCQTFHIFYIFAFLCFSFKSLTGCEQ